MNWRNITVDNFNYFLTPKEKQELKEFKQNLEQKLIKELEEKKRFQECISDIDLASDSLISLNQWRCKVC